MIVRHKVKDYRSWKKAFDGHASAQKAAGLTKPRVLRSADDPNEIVILMDYKDLKMAKTFGASADLKKTMEAAGVVDQPTIYFVEQYSLPFPRPLLGAKRTLGSDAAMSANDPKRTLLP